MKKSSAVLVLFGFCGLVRADSVTCNIQSPLTGSCSSQAANGVTLTGSAGVTIGGPGVYIPTPDQYQFIPFNGSIQYIQSYSIGAQLTTSGSGPGPSTITVTTTIPDITGEWALYGTQSDNPFYLSGDGALVVTNTDGFHGGLDICADVGCEGQSTVFYATPGVPLQITFFDTVNSPNNATGSVTMLEVGRAVPEPALWPAMLLPLGLLALKRKMSCGKATRA